MQPSETSESRYWSSFNTSELQSVGCPVRSLAFSPAAPHTFATAYLRYIDLFSPQTLGRTRTIRTFGYILFSASFRPDGSAIAASDKSGAIDVLQVSSGHLLATLSSHSSPVRFTKYPALDKIHLVSGCDEGLVKYWDAQRERVILDLQGHDDYVTSGDCSPLNPDSFITGSGDHTVKLWDARVGDGNRAVGQVNHGEPVNDVLFLPSGGLVASAGGNTVKVWDLVRGGKLVYSSTESHKATVTSICRGQIVGREKGKGTGDHPSMPFRILSAGLDGYVNVLDYASSKVTHSIKYPTPLGSVGFSPDCETLVVVGTSEGEGVVHAGKRQLGEEKTTLGYLDRLLKYGCCFRRSLCQEKKLSNEEALISALGSNDPKDVVAVIDEMIARGEMPQCLSNLDPEELARLLTFLRNHSSTHPPKYLALLMRVAEKAADNPAGGKGGSVMGSGKA